MTTDLSTSDLTSLIPLAGTLGITIDDAGRHRRGGVCRADLPPGAGTSTIESKTNFFRGVRSGTVAAHSAPLHVGRTTIVVQTDLTDHRGKRVAQVTQTQAVLT